MNKYMELAKKAAYNGTKNGEGGPFGSVIVDKQGNIIAQANNQVIKNNDPTAHAEIQAIRMASKKIGTYDLKDLILYTSCEPCPMCLSAIIWSNIKEVYYACTREDAGKIGFRDDIIYEYLEGKKVDLLDIKQIDRDECKQIFDEYENNDGVIY